MKKETLSYKHVELPTFSQLDKVAINSENFVPPTELSARGVDVHDNHPLTLFDLSSHSRAREAIHFGLKMCNKGFHVFVVGEERNGRMTATLAYLKQHVKQMPPPLDWVYLNNFTQPHRTKPYSLPAGMGIVLQEKTKELIENVKVLLNKMLSNAHYLRQIDTLSASLQYQIDQQISEVQDFAHQRGYEVTQTPDGFSMDLKEGVELEAGKNMAQHLQEVKEKLNRLSISIHLASQKIQKKADELRKNNVQKAIAPLFHKFQEEFSAYLGEWIEELKEDILKHLDDFMMPSSESVGQIPFDLDEWYSVNLFVDNKELLHPKVFLEAHPTYENLFGSIKYQTSMSGSVETNFTMIRPGALHLANGGILVLRAEAIAQDPELWEFLKAALRDQVIRIEERARENSLPLLDAPAPKSIPLDVQVFLIASPTWYYTFFFNDPDFKSYFKIKADIDSDLPATPENIYVYRRLIQQSSVSLTGLSITEDAIDYLMMYSARWVGHRAKLSARFELVGDILTEAGVISVGQEIITEEVIKDVIHQRRVRNSRIEDISHQDIASGQVLIDTKGSVIGQVNGLTVLSTGDHSYGMPARISARTYAGDQGVVNIERLTEMSGPIQQKGMLILEGYLKALFAQKFPLSCSCSLTFEQNYGDVEGDSASMAELVAIISSLSGLPIRQDIAITGSMNQFGLAQSVGGVHLKIEGFHRVCTEQGLTGTQGVIIPRSNIIHLTLRESIVEDIREEKFFIWAVDSVYEAMEILMGKKCGLKLHNGMPTEREYPYYHFEQNSILSFVLRQLERYNKSVRLRHGG